VIATEAVAWVGVAGLQGGELFHWVSTTRANERTTPFGFGNFTSGAKETVTDSAWWFELAREKVASTKGNQVG
jgi:hypothetical protein